MKCAGHVWIGDQLWHAQAGRELSVTAWSTPDKACLGCYASLQLACQLHAGLEGNVVEPGSFRQAHKILSPLIPCTLMLDQCQVLLRMWSRA